MVLLQLISLVKLMLLYVSLSSKSIILLHFHFLLLAQELFSIFSFPKSLTDIHYFYCDQASDPNITVGLTKVLYRFSLEFVDT